MKFSELNESFNQLFESYIEESNKSLTKSSDSCDSLVESLKEVLNRLNEAAISPEDKADSDLIRSVLNKVKNRVNARLTPEEQNVLDKYGIKRTYRKFDTGNLSVNGRDLDRHVDNQSAERFYSKSYNNGNPSEINYADRARKFNTTRSKNSQIFTSPWSADNDQINAHGYNNMMRIKGLQDAERYEQEMPEIDRVETMKRALRDRNYHSEEIAKADSRRDAAIGKAKAEFDKAVSRADRDYEYDTVTRKGYVDRAQKEIDTLLKRESLDEAVSKEAIDTVDIAVDNVVDNFISDISNLAQQIQSLNKGYSADLAAEDGNHPTSVEVEKVLDNLRKALKANLLANSSINEAYDTSDTRKYTNMVLELGDAGLVSWENITMMALKFMSEDDVKRMAELNGLVDYFESDDDELDESKSINESADSEDYIVWEVKDTTTGKIKKIHSYDKDLENSSTWLDDDDIIDQYADDNIVITRFVYNDGLLDTSEVVWSEDMNESKSLKEDAYKGEYASGGSLDTYKRPGGSTQSKHDDYLKRIKSKNPDLVDIMTIKAKDLKPGMLTQAGQIKEVNVQYSDHYGKKMVYVMHTNNWDCFKELDDDVEVMADPDNKSNPFVGKWEDLKAKGLKESFDELDAGKTLTEHHYPELEDWYCDECGKKTDYETMIPYYDTEDDQEELICPDCQEKFRRAGLIESKSCRESVGSDLEEFQKWVDYDMKRYGKISKQTNKEISEAGLKIVKDKYGDYEVIS